MLLTAGHIALVHAILEEWEALCIGIADLDASIGPVPVRPDHIDQVYFDRLMQKTAPARNPFTVPERVDMWEGAIKAAGLQDRVSTAVILIPEFFPEQFNPRYPADEYDIVFGDTTDDFDVLKANEVRRVLRRRVVNIDPPHVMHASTAKEAVRAGASWGDFVLPGAYEVFEAIDGPSRLTV
jgi:nicotinamide mononucleotide adenylyltransferase